MAAFIDLTGQKFNRLTFVSFVGQRRWVVRCDCGTEKIVFASNVKQGLAKSCGCFKTESAKSPERRKAVGAATTRKWAEGKDERRAARQARWRAKIEADPALKQRVAEGKRRCYERRREHYVTRIKANYAADPEKYITRERLKATLRKEATPPWADISKIKELYREARRLTKETGIKHHVDHRVPLRHKLVCGLHWEGNMQVIPAAENWAKHNKLLPDEW